MSSTRTHHGNSVLFAGTSHPELAGKIAKHLGITLGACELESFPDGEISVQIKESVRGKDVFIIQSIALRPNHFLMELLIMVDALRRASANSIVAVIPYFGYCRQDRKDKGRVPITAKLVANLLVEAGVTRVLTMDLHAAQVQGFFDIPVDNLSARPILAESFRRLNTQNPVVVTPDIGSVKLAGEYASQLGVDFAIVDKQRTNAMDVEVVTVIGDVKGKDVLLADDMCSTGGTLESAAKACREKGAHRIFAAITHGLFIGNAVQVIESSPLDVVWMSDTVPFTERLSRSTKIKCLSVSALFAEAIDCIVSQKSISSLYNELGGPSPHLST